MATIGSSTDPAAPESGPGSRIARGSAGVRPRPRKRSRSVSYERAPPADAPCAAMRWNIQGDGSRGEPSPWMFHLMAAHGASAGGALSYETDRLRFLGRGRTPADPRAMREPGPLSGAAGSVLDPIVAIRGRYVLDPD